MKLEKLVIASNNGHKIEEISSILSGSEMKIFSLKDFPEFPDPEETGNTLEENSLIKAKAVSEKFNMPAIADDTGLFVNALNGEPGVYSARYSGENATYESNCQKLLDELKDKPDRSAEFRSVICLYINEPEKYFFEGIVKGSIINEKRGEKGFGYDPLFLPLHSEKTFAELTGEEKNKISHRSLALQKLKQFFD
ncbi:MAG: RdgB/HAM1 family non-canonical purine NTP pyrophosphatase [Bacteroidetes bacterium]|nr:RdgB/HAM1 family non-canonical purine NTP pyrophosphatase [Bacteroidota bacterium]